MELENTRASITLTIIYLTHVHSAVGSTQGVTGIQVNTQMSSVTHLFRYIFRLQSRQGEIADLTYYHPILPSRQSLTSYEAGHCLE